VDQSLTGFLKDRLATGFLKDRLATGFLKDQLATGFCATTTTPNKNSGQPQLPVWLPVFF
jgi:hypothetical protein